MAHQYQNYQAIDDSIRQEFLARLSDDPTSFERPLTLSWSNWGFGIEPLEVSASRLKSAGLDYIELHGNLYGPDLGYDTKKTRSVLADSGLLVSGVCGMYSTDSEFASNVPSIRQRALEYTVRQLEFTAQMGGVYLLVVPGAVGRPERIDQSEWERSVESLQRVAHRFAEFQIAGAIEPIRSDEVSLVHTVEQAKQFIDAVGSAGIQHINGDIYHMQSSERHIGEAIIAAGERLINLHVADSNRGALGTGSMDIDTVIRALYLLGYNRPGRFVTPEPLGPGASPYRAMWGKSKPADLDRLVQETVSYFRERERAVVGGC